MPTWLVWLIAVGYVVIAVIVCRSFVAWGVRRGNFDVTNGDHRIELGFLGVVTGLCWPGALPTWWAYVIVSEPVRRELDRRARLRADLAAWRDRLADAGTLAELEVAREMVHLLDREVRDL